MKTLTIENLSTADVLDRDAMAAISGGGVIDQRVTDLIASVLSATSIGGEIGNPFGPPAIGNDPGFSPRKPGLSPDPDPGFSPR